ncbi:MULTISPECIES: tyrosine-type recombinase/integrase [Pseudomonas]|uniref:Site-specific tyrosine recombinase XerD n=1 Tax=Pseudomonas putida TaxID=303 RepID=A0A1B2F2Q8_PSEPU|nr:MULTISPECIES: tyrosine-type recombinase/integrase [Pseudomonas]ANY86491.1 site-specific tyrosine recombinase XerD [Pseudomonas putida]MCL8305219.1 tyrosine-type recombinase/integrase [Pseudomonas putida]
MTTAKHLLQTLKAFHLDNPEASWEELRDNLRDIAEEALGNPQGEAYGLVLSDVSENLAEIAETMPMSLPQAQAVLMAQRVLVAAQGRHRGDVRALVELLNGDLKASIGNVNQDVGSDSREPVPASICISPSTDTSTTTSGDTTFQALYDAFKAERGGDKSDNTLKNWKSCTSTIVGHLKDADMAKHTRATFVGLRDALLATGGKVASVNKVITHASSVIGWAVATGLIERDFSKKLTITKGAESDRIAFSQDHLKVLQGWAVSNFGEDWRASVIALGVATGARIGEVHQLTGSDIYKVEGQWVVDINDRDGKTLKNKFSRRMVPLLGIPEDHLEKLSQTQGRLFTQSKSGFDQLTNQMIRDLLGTKTGEGLSFHSLRHSLSSELKTAGVSLGILQAILGHSSGAIAFDVYGGNAAASRGLMVEALRLVR